MSADQLELPKTPSLSDLGLTLSQAESPTSKASDSLKKVAYASNKIRNTRPYQQKGPSHWKKKYPELVITPYSEILAKHIIEKPVAAIDAPTGTGKTLYIPYTMANKGFKVRVAIPTIVAVKNAFRFQREHSTLKIGYAAGREINYSEDDQLVYATTGHFTQRIITLIKTGRKDQIAKILGDILFVDEVHTATSQTTLLIGLVKYIFGESKSPKIVFSSATFNINDITDYYTNFPIYKINVPSKTVFEKYLEKERDPLKDDPNPLIESLLKEELEQWNKSVKKYHGIVFRPGLLEVETTIEYLEEKFPSIEFYPAYSNLSPVELDEIFRESANMKVVVGTNIIESSVTIKDVGFIIDDMLEKIAETSWTGGDRLTLALISKAESNQRKGRTGRTMEGRCYRLVTKEQFDQLAEFRIREIDRIPIYDIILQLLDAKLDPREILKISVSRYDQAHQMLIKLGMIENRADRFFVTEIGRFVSSLPISVHNAFMVYNGYRRFVEKLKLRMDISAERILFRTIIAVSCMIEAFGPSYFYVPRRNRGENVPDYNIRRDDYIEQYHEKFRGETDIHTLVNVFWEMMTLINVAHKYDLSTSHVFTNYVKEWCVDNSMNHKKIQEYLRILRDVESIIESKLNDETDLKEDLPNQGKVQTIPRGYYGGEGFSLGRDLPEGGYDVLGNVTAGVFAQAYQMNRFVKEKNGYVDRKTGISYKISKYSSFNSSENPLEIIAAQTIEMVGKGGGRVYLAGLFVTEKYL